MLSYTAAEPSSITKLVCPLCKEKVPRVGLLNNSQVSGLTFKCKKCGSMWQVQSDSNTFSAKK